MAKMRFAIIGNGWRAKFYIRIAKFLKEKYEIVGVLCRTKEKVLALKEEYDVFATVNEQDIIDANPDFIVVSVSKPFIYEVSDYWRSKGFTVLCETSVATNLNDLTSICTNQDGKGKLVVAEQYQYYPLYKSIIDAIEEGKIGTPVSAYVSLAHEYHGASLLRKFLQESFSAPFKMQVNKYELPVTKTGDRYYIYTDGEIIKRNKVVANIEFDDGKVAIYDFDSEQYHSLIRHNMLKISGTRGEIINEKIYYLDSENVGHEEILFDNLQSIRFDPDENQMSEDEIAIEVLMEKTYLVSKSDKEAIKWQKDNLANALQDAYFTILLQSDSKEWLESQEMPWH